MIGVILQPNYIPWRGYFDLINSADIFVFLDDVQYTERDWRNRNIVRNEKGLQWLTVPVVTKGLRGQLIKDAKIDNNLPWGEKHWTTLRHCYSKAKHFNLYKDILEDLYCRNWNSLCDMNIEFIYTICRLLSINNTRFIRSSSLNIYSIKTERLVNICKKLDITAYVSGPAGSNYIENRIFEQNNIRLIYKQYDYPPYPQLHFPFEPNVTVLDLLFNCGCDSLDYIRKSNGNE